MKTELKRKGGSVRFANGCSTVRKGWCGRTSLEGHSRFRVPKGRGPPYVLSRRDTSCLYGQSARHTVTRGSRLDRPTVVHSAAMLLGIGGSPGEARCRWDDGCRPVADRNAGTAAPS